MRLRAYRTVPGARAAALILLVLTVAASVTSEAPAMIGGSEASPDEAPWAVKITQLANDRRTEISGCSGALIADGLIVTARHCILIDDCNTKSRYWAFKIRYSNGKTVRTRGSVYSLKTFRCSRDMGGKQAKHDIAVLRVKKRGLSGLPLASPSERASLMDKGVTYFAAGLRESDAITDRPAWVDKSPDHAWVMRKRCSRVPSYNTCFQRTRSDVAARQGDSGSPWVGWVNGQWKLLAVLSGFPEKTDEGEVGAASVTASSHRKLLRYVLKKYG